MSTSIQKSAEQVQLHLHHLELRGHVGTRLAVTFAAAVLGGLIGSIAGSPGIAAGSIIGSFVGALAAIGFDRNLLAQGSLEHEIDEIESEAERMIESRRPLRPPERR
jgi:fructose-specific phosphotransferase system IIC component